VATRRQKGGDCQSVNGRVARTTETPGTGQATPKEKSQAGCLLRSDRGGTGEHQQRQFAPFGRRAATAVSLAAHAVYQPQLRSRRPGGVSATFASPCCFAWLRGLAAPAAAGGVLASGACAAGACRPALAGVRLLGSAFG